MKTLTSEVKNKKCILDDLKALVYELAGKCPSPYDQQSFNKGTCCTSPSTRPLPANVQACCGFRQNIRPSTSQDDETPQLRAPVVNKEIPEICPCCCPYCLQSDDSPLENMEDDTNYCLPICTKLPVNITVPSTKEIVTEKPWAACNPPQILLAYKISEPLPLTKSRSRELRGSILYVGCDCEKKNGLQDDCPRSECQGNPECLVEPPRCRPSAFSCGKHLYQPKVDMDNMKYQRYPAFFQCEACS